MTGLCAHCGLPLATKRIALATNSGPAYFCCRGCRLAYQLLHSAQEARAEVLARELGASRREDASPGAAIASEFFLDGMTCEACAPIVRELLLRRPGVVSAQVNFITGRVRVTHDPGRAPLAQLHKRLARYGYRVRQPEDDERSGGLIRLSLGLFLAMDIMMLAVPEYLNAFSPAEAGTRLTLRLIMLGLLAPILLWIALPIFRKAAAAVAFRRPDLNLLVTVGTLAAVGMSLAGLLTSRGHVYFETAAFLPVIIMVGQALEERARRQARAALNQLAEVVPATARLVGEGGETEVEPETLTAGMRVVVRAGERAPCDGAVVSGEVTLDESLITGEAAPRRRAVGARVAAGALAVAGEAVVEVIAPLEQSLIAAVVSAVERAEVYRGWRPSAMDRAVAVMTPAVIGLGLGAGLAAVGAGAGREEGLLRFMAVVLFACPCALSLAAPLARAIMTARAALAGVVIRDAAALEKAGSPRVIVFDKTGTVSSGRIRLAQTAVAPGAGIDGGQALAFAAALNVESTHPVGRALVLENGGADTLVGPNWGDRSVPPTNLSSSADAEGRGRRGTVASVQYLIGSRGLMLAEGVELPEWAAGFAESAAGEGRTVSFLARRDPGAWRVLAGFSFEDQLRPESKRLVARLAGLGIEAVLASGDLPAAARHAAAACGIGAVHAELTPERKRDLVLKLRAEHGPVWMVGDGVNDAPALAVADLGIAVGDGTRLAAEAAHVTLTSGIAALPELIVMGAQLRRTVRMNLIWAAAYNLMGLPAAFLGLIRPVFSALAMAASSASVVANSLRLRRDERAVGATLLSRRADRSVGPTIPNHRDGCANIDPGEWE